jgi:hypothetical protein
MNGMAGTGVGVSVISLFLRYAVGIMPKAVAWTGVAIGVLIVVLDSFGMKLGMGVIILYVIGALCIGWALHLTFWTGSKPVATLAPSGNTIGDINGNQGIITQEQTGDNRMAK